MRPLLLSTACFPPARYVAACLQAEQIVIEQHETWPKQTCRNHYEIAGPNGRQKLTVPVSKPFGNHTQTKDVRITHDLPWQKIHWRSAETAYNRSPYLLFYEDRFRRFFERRYEFLIDFNAEILAEVLGILGAAPKVTSTSGYVRNPEEVHDLRETLSAKKPDPGIQFPPYTQPFTEQYGFLANLSVLDVICCLGPDVKGYLEEVAKASLNTKEPASGTPRL